MEPSSPHRRAPVPQPIEDDPFEMDWPWPTVLPPRSEAPAEPSVAELESAADASDESIAIDGAGA